MIFTQTVLVLWTVVLVDEHAFCNPDGPSFEVCGFNRKFVRAFTQSWRVDPCVGSSALTRNQEFVRV